MLDFLLKVFELTAFDNCDILWWRTDGKYAPVTLFINCNDVFWWGTSDLERLTPENIHILEQAIKDIKEAGDGHTIYADMLFCARVRKMRPQGAAYPQDKNLWPLFDACGPEREINIANPYKPGRE